MERKPMSASPFLRSSSDHPFRRFVKFTTCETPARSIYLNVDHILSMDESQGRTKVVHTATDRCGDNLVTYADGSPESIIVHEIFTAFIDVDNFLDEREEFLKKHLLLILKQRQARDTRNAFGRGSTTDTDAEAGA